MKTDYRQAQLTARQRTLCEFADKLTVTPWQITKEDIARLRDAGLADKDIVDLAQVVAFFNYINRIADGLGVDREDWMK